MDSDFRANTTSVATTSAATIIRIYLNSNLLSNTIVVIVLLFNLIIVKRTHLDTELASRMLFLKRNIQSMQVFAKEWDEIEAELQNEQNELIVLE